MNNPSRKFADLNFGQILVIWLRWIILDDIMVGKCHTCAKWLVALAPSYGCSMLKHGKLSDYIQGAWKGCDLLLQFGHLQYW